MTISNAYEDSDLDFMHYILREASERPDSSNEHYARTRDTEIHALEFGAALQEAMRAKEEGDLERYSLMIGFTVGLMFRYQNPDDGVEGTVRARIISGYKTESYELLQQAQGTLAFGARMSDPMGFMGKEEAARYYEERVRTMRWVQNFALRETRSADETTAIPNSLSINYQLIQQSTTTQNTEIGEETEYEELTLEDLLEGDSEANAIVNSGVAKRKNEDYNGAIADFNRAIAIEPDNVEAFVNRALCKQDAEDYQGAIADWDRALELKPDDGGWYVNRGMIKEIVDDIDGAIADFSQAAEAEPDYVVAYIARAYNRNKQGDYEGAIADYDRVIELWPDNAVAFDERGLVKSRLGNYDDAVVDFNRAIELQPSNAEYHLNRGTAKTNAKDYLGAIADLARAIELDPDKARADEAEVSQMASNEPVEKPPRPIEMCYWVEPGKLLAGEYPGHWEEDKAKEKLACLTNAGVSAFIDLTDPATTDGHLKPYAHLLGQQCHQRVAIRDQCVPASTELTKAALDAIDAHISAGRTVYVHCWGGVGRTGTIIGCWLARHYETGQAALDRLTELWKENPKSISRCSPETADQARYVLDWREDAV